MSAPNVDQVRHTLGGVSAIVGVMPQTAPDASVQQDAMRRLEAAEWPAVWSNEMVGADSLVRSALWLAATERMVVGTCIANVWVRPAATAHAAATQLAQAYPQRFVLGLGVGRAEQAERVGRDFGSPATTARAYLSEFTDREYPLLLGANGPTLLRIAADHTDGALPAGQPPDGTARAREAIGAERLLAIYLPITAHEEPDTIASTVAAHHTAGADHVIVGQSYQADFDSAVDRLEELGPVLVGRI